MSAADGFRYTPVLVVYEAPFPEGVFAVFFAVLSTAVTFAVFPARSRAVDITLTFARVRHAQIRKRLMRISWAFRGTSYPNIQRYKQNDQARLPPRHIFASYHLR